MASRGRDFLGELSEDSADQILGFMRFFQLKRESFLSLVASEFEEAADMLDESEYTRAEVAQDVLGPMKQSVRHTVREEHSTQTNMMVLLLKSILEDSEAQGTALEFDLGMLEDAALLQEVSQLRVEARAKRDAGEAKAEQTQRRLTSLKDEHMELVREKSRLEGEVARGALEARELQITATEALRDKSRLEGELSRCRASLAGAQEECRRLGGAASGQVSEAAEAKEHARRVEGELDLQRRLGAEAKGQGETTAQENARLSEEVDRLRSNMRELMRDRELRGATGGRDAERGATGPSSISGATQVQQLRRLLQQKNALVADLRARLRRYEPDADALQAEDD
mmetsp:Transcript_60098/g.135887  ORF Transcript_60098/g.135887 Transcript_60098/m.135887 type:complete len:342 (-) Transcript_60098:207-1232(-)